jgi:3D (Asp-Asp-Asp) domain-containing protein
LPNPAILLNYIVLINRRSAPAGQIMDRLLVLTKSIICAIVKVMQNYLLLIQNLSAFPMIFRQFSLKFLKISHNLVEKSIIFLLILALIWQFAFPRITSLAATLDESAMETIEKEIILSAIEAMGDPIRIINVPVTAYNSLPGQTDSTPCITANGFDLCQNNQQNVVAANFLKFGTKVRFPDYDPDTIYTVQDRMNARYAYRADIWMQNHNQAIQFGIKNLKMEIYQ